jgi:hypothetical protein
MNLPNRRLRILLLGFFLLLSSMLAHAQFQYFGASTQFLLAPTKGSQAIIAANWLMQFSMHHGVGLELGMPFYFVTNPAAQLDGPIDPRYALEMDWKRKMSPLVALRYRFFLGNVPFIGLSVGGGLISESLVATRDYQAGSIWQSEVPAVHIDQSVRSPFYRLTAETGLVPNIGKRMYALIQIGMGLQVTKAPIFKFGDVEIDEGENYRLRPYHGKDIFGNFQFGMGFKL